MHTKDEIIEFFIGLLATLDEKGKLNVKERAALAHYVVEYYTYYKDDVDVE
jgi:hypothetical protein